MPGPRRKDDADDACEQWANPMRELLGLVAPREYLGSVRCTLAARRDLHHGSRSGRVEQRWPEFPFRDQSLAVQMAYRRLPEPLQEIMVAHWCVLTPRDKRLRAELMGISPREYWLRVGRAKAAVYGALAVAESVCTLTPEIRGISGTV